MSEYVVDGTVPSGRDPLADLRGDIEATSPLQRALEGMRREEVAEARRAAEAKYERQAAAEAAWQQQAAEERVQRMVKGHTDRELAAYNREVAERKAARIRELEAELARLDPSRRGTAARFAGEYGSEQRPAVRIMRADGSFAELGPREVADPAGMPPPVPEPHGREFMEKEIRRYQDRCEHEASMRRWDEIHRLEGEVSRAQEYREAQGWARRTFDVDFRFE